MGCSPDRERARTQAAAVITSSDATEAEALNVGLRCNRIQACVITPIVPSEPMISRSGARPALEPGSCRVSTAPAGVSMRVLSTKSSMCVACVA